MGEAFQEGKFIASRYTTALDYSGDNLIYLGLAAPGSDKAAKKWQIRKFTYSGTNVTDIQYANGSLIFNQVWDDRAGLSYS